MTNPRFQFAYLDKVADWPEIEYSDTPQFYFFADNKVITSVDGWPREGRKRQMLEAYEKAKSAIRK